MNTEAAAEVDRMKTEMEQAMKAFEDETIKSALHDVESRCAAMQESLRAQYESSLQVELERQRDKLSAECVSILQEKEDEIKRNELDIKRYIEILQRQHRMELESTENRVEALSSEIWDSARQESSIEAEQRISQVITDTEKQCQSRDEQISALLAERDFLQKELKDKELEVKQCINDLVDLDHAFVDVAREIKTRHHNEIMRLHQDKIAVVQEKEELQEAIRMIESDNASLNNELVHLRLEYKAMELKRMEQEEEKRACDQRKNETVNHLVDIHSCKHVLDRQVADLKLENHSLTQTLQQKTLTICELNMELKQQSVKASNLGTRIEELHENTSRLQKECVDMKRKYIEANERAESLQQEKRRYEMEMEHRMRQKELQVTQALEAVGGKSNRKNEPVVVHLHGNNGEGQKYSSIDATNECNHLRSRLLEVQRENYRLESELMEAKRVCRNSEELQNVSNQDASDLQKVYEENAALKQIVTMMRKDIENFTNSLEPSNPEQGNHISSQSYNFSLEQQLVQCRAYLDILLKVRCVDNKVSSRGALHFSRQDDDEVPFLRLRYKELHDALDQVRGENLRLRQESESRQYNNNTGPTLREKELILNLEEASDEIEALIEEREELLTLSNRLKNELKWIKERQIYHSSASPQSHLHSAYHDDAFVLKNDENIMNAILNDMSRSFDGETHADSSDENAIVACFGKKPPLLRASNFRPSQNAHSDSKN
ncbi:hypothetical protein HJC23_001517 [Cyclotella cryptica]|uniref:Uncharacterized protein n=1 Tax=Cyclotella cryptica TaxID=29204 RepID=A0ABD3P649_9STRA